MTTPQPDDLQLLTDAARMVITSQSASISTLQRKLYIGYARATRLLYELELYGVVGPSIERTRVREVLARPDELNEVLARIREVGRDKGDETPVTGSAEIIAAALHDLMCGGDTYAGDPSVQHADRSTHAEQAAAALAALAEHGLTPAPTVTLATLDQAHALLGDVARELSRSGRIGNSLLTGSNPNAATLAREELLDRLVMVTGARLD
ncbi:DNA translocase FtsK [Nonomuraea endophytica]|uniref:DNA translocase FtsK n=1 Tax=Nonomuraea endophytica TaxID=714136 RepID=UPI0037CA284E